MATWNYEAHDKLGQPSVGSVEASSEMEAAEMLRKDGLYAREISTDPVRQKYEHGATGGEAGHRPKDEHPIRELVATCLSSLDAGRMDPPGPAKAPSEIQVCVGFSGGGDLASPPRATSSTGLPGLARELEAISRVVAQMSEWEQAYRSARPGERLPAGVPSVGGKTWDLWNSGREDYVAGLLATALRNGVVEAQS